MKNVFILLFVFVQALFVSAQNKNCTTPLSNDDFQLKMNEVATKDNETAKLEAAKKIVVSNCVLASQVKQLAVTFKSDLNRLDFAKAAYNNTFDKANFYEVYDAFGYFSNVFKLHDYIKSGQSQFADSKNETKSETKTETKTETKPVLKYPAWEFPDASTYKDIAGCPTALNEKEFDAFANQVFETPQDANRLKMADAFIQKNCLSATQIMKITSLINPEGDKMALLKKGIFHCYDVTNYVKTVVCVNTVLNKKQLQDFIRNSLQELGGGKQQTNTAPPCEVFDKDFQEVKQAITNQKFNNSRIAMAKQLISDKKCFSAFQLKEIVKLIEFEDGKLDVAKYSYDFCIDKSNFMVKFNDAFDFDNSKNELMKYIQTRK